MTPHIKRPIVGHIVTYDNMGPNIAHPLSCSSIQPAISCPHYLALNLGRVVGRATKGKHVAILRDGYLHLLPTATMTSSTTPPPMELKNEIIPLLDAYVDEVGDAGGVVKWLRDRGPNAADYGYPVVDS